MEKEISFAYIKSEGIGGRCEQEIYKLISEKSLELLWIEDIYMDYIKLRKHQPILFNLRDDLNDIWKIQGMARMIGSSVRTLTILGEDAIDKTRDIKTYIRGKYALPCEFDKINEISYPNYMHAADNRPQVENDIKILVPEKLIYLRSINGINEIKEKVW